MVSLSFKSCYSLIKLTTFSAWLTDNDYPLVAKISNRVAHMTNLDLKSAEALQVFF